MNRLRVKTLDSALATAEAKSLKRSLGFWQLTLLGIGGIIGTGIFVLTSEAAQKAGPGMMASFAIAGLVCVVAALCYSELAAMIPVSGSAYTYSYVAFGEIAAWLVGWALVLEYGVAASAVSVGWSGYFVGQLQGWFGLTFPPQLAAGPLEGGFVNLPAVCIGLAVTGLLMIGTTKSAQVNTILVTIKSAALVAFIVLAVPAMQMENFTPFSPLGWQGGHGEGILGAAASIFFAYVGFDAVSTAAEETKDPQRNLPLGLIASLGFCTLLYVLVAAGAIGSAAGAQPVTDAAGGWLQPGSAGLADRCAALSAGGIEPLACSKEALAHILRTMGHANLGNLVGLAAFLALPSVILVMLYGQTRMFFVMARDGLLPPRLARIHPRWNTPHLITAITGAGIVLASAFLPVGRLADIANTGTLSAFVAVAGATVLLRFKEPNRARPFRTPFIGIIAPAAIAGCLALFWSLPPSAKLVLPVWGAIGLLLYFAFGFRNSALGKTADRTA